MPGEKAIDNKIAGFIYISLMNQLYPGGYEVFNHDVKVASQDRQKYFYPDVFVIKEQATKDNQCIRYEPELIVEVVSSFSRITDTVDKYIDYSAIPSLKYYLVVEPEVTYITRYAKNEEGKRRATLYSSLNDVILLPLLELSLPLSEVYR
jgi:Uma2 family endonuclease